MVEGAQLFATYKRALHIADLSLLFFIELPTPQDPDLPEDGNTGNPEVVALLTALSQVCPHFPLSHSEFEEP